MKNKSVVKLILAASMLVSHVGFSAASVTPSNNKGTTLAKKAVDSGSFEGRRRR